MVIDFGDILIFLYIIGYARPGGAPGCVYVCMKAEKGKNEYKQPHSQKSVVLWIFCHNQPLSVMEKITPDHIR